MDQQQVPPPAPEKKGMPVIAWVGIGCGTLLVLGVVLIALLVGKCKRWADEVQRNPEKAGAEMMVKLNPDLDLVSQDEVAGQMTVRNNKTGEQVTLDYKDITEGRLTVTDAEGTVTEIGAGSAEAPEWVPRLPDAESSLSLFHNESGNEVSGMLSIRTSASADEVAEFFEKAAADGGLGSSNKKSMSMNGTETRTLVFEGSSKTLNVQITSTGSGPAVVQVAYTEKK